MKLKLEGEYYNDTKDEDYDKMKIPIKYIIELGLIRKRERCAKCDKKMDVPDYHIQLCNACRKLELDKYAKEILKNDIKD